MVHSDLHQDTAATDVFAGVALIRVNVKTIYSFVAAGFASYLCSASSPLSSTLLLAK